MNRQEAQIESQKAEIKSLQRDLESMQNIQNNWDEVILNSIQGVHVLVRGVSSQSRVTEPAISHLPQAGSDRELFQQRGHSMPKAAPKLAAAPIASPENNSKASLAVPISSAFNIASGLRKILTGNFRNQLPQLKGKLHQSNETLQTK